MTIGDAVGGVALDKQVVQYIADSAATCNMTPDADGLTNYRECSRPLGLANGEEISIVGYGDLTVNFRTDHRWVRVKMNDVAHVPQLSHNLISLPSMTLKGHTYMGDKGGVTLKLKGGETVFFPLVGKLCRQYGFRPEAAGSMVDSACTTIAPGKTKTPTTPTDINILHCTSGHTHEVLLKKEQQGVNPSGELHECRGCSMARGLRKSIARSTHTGADTLRLSRTPAAAAPYCQRGGVYSGGGRERGGGVKSRRRRVQGVDSEFSLGNAAEVWPPVLPATREALAAELGAGAAGVRKATPQHHRPPPGGEAPAAESGAGAAGVRKTTPRHHRPPPGGEAPAAELGAGAAGARKATPRHHRPPSGGEAPAAELGAGAAGVRKATPQHHRPPPGGEAPAAELGAGAAGARKATPRHHRPPSGGEAPAAEFAAAATGVRTATPRHQRFPREGRRQRQNLQPRPRGCGWQPLDASGFPREGRRQRQNLQPRPRGCSRGHGGAEGNPPTPSVPPGRADFGGINGNSSSYSSEDSRTSSDSSSGNDGGDFPTHARRPARDLEAFGELPVLQSGHTRSQSRGSAMGASCADDLLAYAMRAMEAEKPTEEKAAEVERAHDSLLEEQLEKEREWLEKLEGRGIGPRARDVRGCRV